MTLFGFGKKKEKEINAPVCTCNGNCSVSETVEPENLNNCCQDIQGRICCIKVLSRIYYGLEKGYGIWRYECTCSCCQQQSSIYGESAENRKRAKTVTKNRFRKINLISNLRLIINNSNSDLMLCKTTKLPNVGR